MNTRFDAKGYWESRLSSRFDLQGVGDIRLPQSYNRFLYRVRAHAFASIVRPLDLEAGCFDALDVGSGTGFYIEQWLRRRPRRLTGCDLTLAAVKQLGAKFPGTEFAQCDIGAPQLPPLAGWQFDVVSAMDMLFHIVDDEAYAAAFANFSRLVRPGGRLIFSDNLMPIRKSTVPHHVSRAERYVREVIGQSGFEIERISPMFVLMNDPVRSDSRIARKFFATIYRLARKGEIPGMLTGGVIYPAELLAIRLLSRGPSTEIVVCRRRKNS